MWPPFLVFYGSNKPGWSWVWSYFRCKGRWPSVRCQTWWPRPAGKRAESGERRTARFGSCFLCTFEREPSTKSGSCPIQSASLEWRQRGERRWKSGTGNRVEPCRSGCRPTWTCRGRADSRSWFGKGGPEWPFVWRASTARRWDQVGVRKTFPAFSFPLDNEVRFVCPTCRLSWRFFGRGGSKIEKKIN